MRWLTNILAALLSLLAFPLWAQDFSCEPLKAATAEADVNAAVIDKSRVRFIQAGVRSIFGADRGLLSDSIIGPVTTKNIETLCALVPLPPGTPAINGTLDVSEEFGQIFYLRKKKQLVLADTTLMTSIDPGDYNRRFVRFAANANSASAALDALYADERGICGNLQADSFEPAPYTDLLHAQSAMAEIIAHDPKLHSVGSPLGEKSFGPVTRDAAHSICQLYPVIGGASLGQSAAQDFLDAMADLGKILDVRPDAIQTISSPEFRNFVEEVQVSRLARLLGTPPAVIELLHDFGPGVTTPGNSMDEPDGDLYAECDIGGDLTNVVYWSLSKEEIDGVVARANVRATLEPLLEERFETPVALDKALADALAVQPGTCSAFRLSHILNLREAKSEVYGIDAQKTKDLALEPEFADLLPALKELAGAEAESSEAVGVGVRAKIDEAAEKAAKAEIAEAIEVASKAAEDITLSPDTAAQGLPEELPPDEQPKTELAITDASIKEITAQIDNPVLLKALTEAPEAALETRADIAEMVENELTPLGPEIANMATEAAVKKIKEVSLIEKKYRLTPGIINDLANSPEFAALTDVPPDALADLAGVQYPTERLMAAAINAAFPPNTPSEDRLALLTASEKTVAEGPRVVAPLGEDCGCVRRYKDDSQVYAFWPFWIADLEPATQPKSGTAPDDGTGSAASAGVARIDFELVGRVAFDGLLIDGGEEDAARDIQNKNRWKSAAPNFVLSAHKHQAKADLSIRIRNWENWGRADISTIADGINELLLPVAFPEETEAEYWLEQRLDRYLNRAPDGVTLVLEIHPDDALFGLRPEMENVIELVKRISEGLPAKKQTINLAFDAELLETDGASTEEFLTDLDSILPGATQPKIDRLLLFLERPTTSTKKTLRKTAEQIYNGVHRVELLRSIIPVVPEGGHATILSSISTEPYSQFVDDVIYFQDNFGGIGLWLTQGSQKDDPLRKIVIENFSASTEALDDRAASQRTHVVQTVGEILQPVCDITCPKRYVVYFTMIVSLVLVAIVVWLSLYNGVVNSLARRFFIVPALFIFVLLLLLLTQFCDAPPYFWALWAFLLLFALMIIVLIFQAYQRRIDGPLP